MTCALEFKHVSKAFGTNKVLNDVCLMSGRARFMLYLEKTAPESLR